MRHDEADEQHPWLVGTVTGAAAQPVAGLLHDPSIILGIGRLSPARHLGELPRRATLAALPAQPAETVADAVDHVHRVDLLAEAVVVVVGAIVQLADGSH